MRKIKLLAIFTLATAFTAPAFSVAQLGVQGNYQNVTFKPSSGSLGYSGFGFGAVGRFTAGIPLLITFAAGPYMDFATLTTSTAGNGDISHLRVGGEIAIYADVIGNVTGGFTPYARFGYGYENNSVKGTTTTTSYSGSGGHTIVGVSKSLVPLVHVFVEGGAQWSSLSASGTDLTTSGYRLSLGAMIWL